MCGCHHPLLFANLGLIPLSEATAEEGKTAEISYPNAEIAGSDVREQRRFARLARTSRWPVKALRTAGPQQRERAFAHPEAIFVLLALAQTGCGDARS